MQPKRPLLPELYALRDQPEAGPICRPWHGLVAKALRKLADTLFELSAARERLRLIGGPGTDLAVARPGGEIGVRFRVADQFYDTFDTDLTIQRLPQKAQRRIWINEQFRGFSALEIGVKYKSSLIDLLQQYQTN